MNPVARGICIYLFILVVFRIMGKRSLKETTTFDFVLLLIISETTTDALIGEDYSLTACFVMILTLVGFDLGLNLVGEKWKIFGKVTNGAPLVLVDNGKLLKSRMEKCRVEKEDILEAARLTRGIDHLNQVKYAVLERDGNISIIPMENYHPAFHGQPADSALT